MNGYIANIEADTLANDDFRRVLYTASKMQLVLMSLPPGTDIGEETHGDVDQFIRCEAGDGKAILNGLEHPLTDGTAVVIPAGVRHNILNTSTTVALKLYTIYAPPEHKDKIVRKTKAEDMAEEEHFYGKTTE